MEPARLGDYNAAGSRFDSRRFGGPRMLRLHNLRLLDHLRHRYTADDVARLAAFLRAEGTFRFEALPSGLYPAAQVDVDDPSGYAAVWIRDNVHVAHALLVDGDADAARRTIDGLTTFLFGQRRRFAALLARELDPREPMNRPHIRFDGRSMNEIDVRWAHAQNDALGYYLWMSARMIDVGASEPTPRLCEVLAAVALFLELVDFPRDEDSGHWEETRKRGMSSVGAATAGLAELSHVCRRRDLAERLTFDGRQLTAQRLDRLVSEGRSELAATLPYECRDPDPAKRREADAALLFLIYPLEIVDAPTADAILQLVLRDLAGEIGIRRYRGDSYWCADYKRKLEAERRSADFSDDLSERDALLDQGQEAQWCIFDPIVSAAYGRRFAQSNDPRHLELQMRYLNRSLAHLTPDDCRFGGLRCPESYYLENGRYVPVDQTPLLWTQANLLAALRLMEANLR